MRENSEKVVKYFFFIGVEIVDTVFAVTKSFIHSGGLWGLNDFLGAGGGVSSADSTKCGAKCVEIGVCGSSVFSWLSSSFSSIKALMI